MGVEAGGDESGFAQRKSNFLGQVCHFAIVPSKVTLTRHSCKDILH
jgi:hypothetical protein